MFKGIDHCKAVDATRKNKNRFIKAGLWLFLLLGLMLSSAITALVIGWLGMFSVPTRLFMICGFMILLALTIVPMIIAYREERHTLKMASLQERQDLYLVLLDHLFAVFDSYKQFDSQKLDDLLSYLKLVRTDLFIYGSIGVIRRLDELLNYGEIKSEDAHVKYSTGSELQTCLMKLIQSIHEDLREDSWGAFLPVTLMQGVMNKPRQSKPVLRRYK